MTVPEAILARNLHLNKGRTVVLDGASFAIPDNSLCALLGPNGAGKTTLLKVLLGVERTSQGMISWPGLGDDLGRIGYVPQIKTLDRQFPALAIEVVATGALGRWPWRLSKSLKARCLEALEHVGAASLAKRPVTVLSGGELQRVHLARGIVNNPRLLLLDEPVTGMDAEGEAEFLRLIEVFRERTKACVVMVTHDWSAAMHHAGHLLVLNKRILYCGAPQDADIEGLMHQAFGHRHHHHPRISEFSDATG